MQDFRKKVSGGERRERHLWWEERPERVTAVDKIEEKRKPEDFIGHRNRNTFLTRGRVHSLQLHPVLMLIAGYYVGYTRTPGAANREIRRTNYRICPPQAHKTKSCLRNHNWIPVLIPKVSRWVSNFFLKSLDLQELFHTINETGLCGGVRSLPKSLILFYAITHYNER